MNNLRHILILLFAVFSIGCAISKKENERLNKKNSGQVFSETMSLMGDTISKENLQYFENRVIQKLVDFYDYLNILGHESFNSTIMGEVRSSAEKLFYNSQITINPYGIQQSEILLKTVELLVDENYGDNALPILGILNVEIIEGLHLLDDGYFAGKLQFDIKNDLDAVIVTKEATFSLRRIEKKFGEESVLVWEVFLGQIY